MDISFGIEEIHKIPDNIKKELELDFLLLEKWNGLTAIARNEWICWVCTPKLEKTKEDHLKRFKEDLVSGKKRPCCWPGCPHRNPKNSKWFNNKSEIK